MASFRRGCSRADSGLGCRPALGRRDLSEVAVLWQLSAHGLNEVVRSEEHLAFQLFPWCRLTLAVGDESSVLRDGIRRRLTAKGSRLNIWISPTFRVLHAGFAVGGRRRAQISDHFVIEVRPAPERPIAAEAKRSPGSLSIVRLMRSGPCYMLWHGALPEQR